MRLFICGGRAYRNSIALNAFLDQLHDQHTIERVADNGMHTIPALIGAWRNRRRISGCCYKPSDPDLCRGPLTEHNMRIMKKESSNLIVSFQGGRNCLKLIRTVHQDLGCKAIHIDNNTLFPDKIIYDVRMWGLGLERMVIEIPRAVCAQAA